MMKRVCNPYLPTYEYIPDGEPYVFGDRIYVFGSHDRFRGDAYCMNDYTCWSAPVNDLSDWRCEGVIYRREQDPTPVAKLQHHMWAPDVMRGADGRYYLYYVLEWYNRVGVAVCDTPAGKYEYYGEVRYQDGTRFGGRPLETMRFDPGVLNDDGRFYLYTGFSCKWLKRIARRQRITITDKGSTVVELAADMLTVISEPKPLLPGRGNSKGTGFEGHEFFEASSMRKYNGKYYAVYSSVLSRELCYAVSDRPDRDFVYGGTLHDNGNVFGKGKSTFYWGNNHGSLVLISGQYYIFGHRQTCKTDFSRQGVAEPIEFCDGRFFQAEMTSQGLNGRPLPCEGSYEAGVCCALYAKGGATHVKGIRANEPYITQEGEDRECDPMQYVANIRTGAVCGYRYFDLPADGVKLTLTVRPHGRRAATGRLEIAFDERFTTITAQDFRTDGMTEIAFALTGASGAKSLYIRYIGKGSIDLISLNFSR